MPRLVSDIVDVYPFRRGPGGAVEFLLLLRAPHTRLGGTWQAVHGGIEAGETAQQAALRELREETGLRPEALWQLERVNTFFMARDDCVMLCPGFAAEVAAAAPLRLSDEHTGSRWLSPPDAQAAFIWPGQRRAVREIMTEIIPGGASADALRIQ
jgi:dATP pyrophosphohydrolase